MYQANQAPARSVSIGVIGAGWLGGTVGRALAEAGHAVTFASRDLKRLTPLAAGLPRARIAPVAEAADCDVVLLATPHAALKDYATTLAPKLKGKIVIDATNPSGASAEGVEGARIGVAELTHSYFPEARMVRCFSAVDATCIEDGHGYGDTTPLGVPLASDDPAALALAVALVHDTGCTPVVTGPLASARAFQRGQPGFRANTNAARLIARMGTGRVA